MPPKTLADFAKTHTATYMFVQKMLYPEIERKTKFIIVDAPVKSGKRTIVEIASLIYPSAKHVFITALNRSADKLQHFELASYLGKHAVHVICRKDRIDVLFEHINKLLKSEKQIIIHHDELDYASGSEHNIKQIWDALKIIPEIQWIMYSASPEEILHSEWYEALDVSQKCHIKYIPPTSYKGAEYFLENDLVFEADPFFIMDEEDEDIELSDQAIDIINNLNDSTKYTNRHILIVRLSTMRIYKYAKELIESGAFDELNDCKILFAHGGFDTDYVPWDSISWWETLDHTMPLVIFIDQVSSRSTEWAGHPYLYAVHDFASTKTSYNTIMQRQLRVAHYTTKHGAKGYNGKGNPIKVYGTVDVFKLAAGKIDYDEFSRKLSNRTKIESTIIAKCDNLQSIWNIPIKIQLPPKLLTFIKENKRLTGSSKQYVMDNLKELAPEYLDGYHLNYVRRYQGEKTAIDNDKLEKHIIAAKKGKPVGLHGGRTTNRTNNIYYLDVVIEKTGKHEEGTAVLTKCFVYDEISSSKTYTHHTSTKSMFSSSTAILKKSQE